MIGDTADFRAVFQIKKRLFVRQIRYGYRSGKKAVKNAALTRGKELLKYRTEHCGMGSE